MRAMSSIPFDATCRRDAVNREVDVDVDADGDGE